VEEPELGRNEGKEGIRKKAIIRRNFSLFLLTF
jgi:hypothetical protein